MENCILYVLKRLGEWVCLW